MKQPLVKMYVPDPEVRVYLADIIKHPTEATSQTYYIASKPVLQKVRRDKVFLVLKWRMKLCIKSSFQG